jgi:hypothetical protein
MASKTQGSYVAVGVVMIMVDLLDEISPRTVYLKPLKMK